jgi:leucyl aminopeptidase
MELVYSQSVPKKVDFEAFGVYESAKLDSELKALGFQGKEGEVAVLPGKIFVGLGKKSELDADTLRIAASKLVKTAKKLKAKRLCVNLFGQDKLKKKAARAVAEGIVLGSYEFKKYKSGEGEKFELEEITVVGKKDYKKEFELGRTLAEAANFTRDIVNEPGNVITPEELSKIAEELAKDYGFECKVFTERELEENKMVGILTVGKGSNNPPRFIHLTYKPKKAKKRIVIVGKGVTFDSGGLNIKPEQFMKTMKSDKAGACAVLGIMKAIGELKPNVEVHALIPTVENMPSGKSYRPDDIIVYKNGKSVEIHSTDAEGRLILADALIYGSELEPDVMIDMATLTGACVVALGHYTSGLFTDDEKLANSLLKVSKETGEKMWQMPLDKDLEEEIKGAYADIQNVGKSRHGGAITAALFLKNFVDFKKVKSWVHIDIAGPAFLDKDWKYYSAGATGQPVRTIAEFLVG